MQQSAIRDVKQVQHNSAQYISFSKLTTLYCDNPVNRSIMQQIVF